jgi:hypothetical protein
VCARYPSHANLGDRRHVPMGAAIPDDAIHLRSDAPFAPTHLGVLRTIPPARVTRSVLSTVVGSSHVVSRLAAFPKARVPSDIQ